jgi:hypothetical protein
MGTELLKPSLQVRQKRRDKRMGEEVIECYRKGRRLKVGKGYGKLVRAEFERGSTAREGIKARYMGATRYPNDNLEPLVRYLRSHRGKHWDGVYADLCRMLDSKSMTGQHVIDHLKHLVHVKVVKENGQWISLDRGKPMVIGEWYWHPRFYVHPISGVLIEAKDTRKRS